MSTQEAVTPTQEASTPPPPSSGQGKTEWRLVLGALVFLALTIVMPVKTQGRLTLPNASWLWPFVLLPGITGLANYIVTSRQRDSEGVELERVKPEGVKPEGVGPEGAKPEGAKPEGAKTKGAKTKAVEPEARHRPTISEAFAAAVLLTAVFSIIPGAIGSDAPETVGILYAGFGAYVSTLWFMLVRLNVNALSPRFLMNSALKASIAMLIGYTAAASHVFTPLSAAMSLPALCVLIGLFHASAMKALKKKAMTTFGVAPVSGADLSVRLLEGVDDGAVDVLEELGITSIQHLATMHAPEVSGRSLYPRYRVLDWIDQSILAMHTNGRLSELRALGIRSAYAFITVAHHSRIECEAASEDEAVRHGARRRVHEIAQRLGLSDGGFYLVARCIQTDPAYVEIERTYPDRHKAKPIAAGGQASSETSEPLLHAREDIGAVAKLLARDAPVPPTIDERDQDVQS
jgi:hypothetical protein